MPFLRSLFSLFFWLSFNAGGQPGYFERIYDFSDCVDPPVNVYDIAVTPLEVPGGGYIFITEGVTPSLSPAGNLRIIVRVDVDGDTLWKKVYKLYDYRNYFNKMSWSSDSNFIICSAAWRYSFQRYFAYLMKISLSGDTIWTREFSYDATNPKSNTSGIGLIEAKDGGFIVVGHTFRWNPDPPFATPSQVYLCKTDSLGRKEWDRAYGGSNNDEGHGVIETDSGYMVVGYTKSFGNGERDLYILGIKKDGSLTWSKNLGGLFGDGALGVSEGVDNSFYLSGYRAIDDSAQKYPLGPTYARGWILKVNEFGIIDWESTYGGDNINAWFYNIQQEEDTSLVAFGGIRNYEDDNARGWLMKTDKNGNELWSREYSWSVPYAGEGDDYFWDFSATADGGFIMGGQVQANPSGNTDAWLVKVDSMGCLAPGCDTICYPFMKPQAEIRRGFTWDPYVDTIYLPQGHSGWVNFWCGDPLGKTLYWDFGDGERDTVLKPLHQYKTAGTFIVTLIAENGPCRDTGTVTLIHGWPTGAEPLQYEGNNSVRVWPNPVDGNSILHVSASPLQGGQRGAFMLYDIMGRVVSEEKMPASGQLEISTAGLKGGMYFYVVHPETPPFTLEKGRRGKLVVQ